MAEKEIQPKCPSCDIKGKEHIIALDSSDKSRSGDAWFNIACCDECGHVYGIFAKHVLNHEIKHLASF